MQEQEETRHCKDPKGNTCIHGKKTRGARVRLRLWRQRFGEAWEIGECEWRGARQSGFVDGEARVAGRQEGESHPCPISCVEGERERKGSVMRDLNEIRLRWMRPSSFFFSIDLISIRTRCKIRYTTLT